MDKKTILIIFLSGLVVFLLLDARCIIDWIPSTCQVDTLIQTDTVEIVGVGAHCNDAIRYDSATDVSGGGKLISTTLVQTYMAEFKARYNQGEQKGVLISKRAIDAIFDNNETANSLVCYFGLGTDGKIQLIFEPKSSRLNLVSTISTNPTSVTVSYFCSESTCPEECGSIY